MSRIVIKLADRYQNKLGIGPTAKKIFDEVKDYEEAILDFENIEFMSRSFAQEYVYQRHNSPSRITEINMNDSIGKLLVLVGGEYEKYCMLTR